MQLHLIKLCVGISEVEELRSHIARRQAELLARGEPLEQKHTTRMVPSRKAELLDGGSLYWVIKGVIQARQRLVDIRPFRDRDGIRRCHLVMDPKLVATLPRPRRAFQGWRYLDAKEAPRDILQGAAGDALPETLQTELAELGLL